MRDAGDEEKGRERGREERGTQQQQRRRERDEADAGRQQAASFDPFDLREKPRENDCLSLLSLSRSFFPRRLSVAHFQLLLLLLLLRVSLSLRRSFPRFISVYRSLAGVNQAARRLRTTRTPHTHIRSLTHSPSPPAPLSLSHGRTLALSPCLSD